MYRIFDKGTCWNIFDHTDNPEPLWDLQRQGKHSERRKSMKVKRLYQYGAGDKYKLYNQITREELKSEYTHAGGWIWEVVWDDGATSSYHTDKDGYGLWTSERQIKGTCQYRAARTYSGQRRKILRDLEARASDTT